MKNPELIKTAVENFKPGNDPFLEALDQGFNVLSINCDLALPDPKPLALTSSSYATR